MNGRVTLILIVVLGLLGGYVYLFEFSSGSDETDNGVTQLFDTLYNEYDIVALEIVSPQGQAQFTRTDKTFTQDWQMVKPQSLSPDQLDQVRVNGAAVRLGRLTVGQVITGVTELSPYGLNPPELTVSLTISSGQKITLLAGKQTPVNDSRYVQFPNDTQTVYLVQELAIRELHNFIVHSPVAPTPLPTITPSPAP